MIRASRERKRQDFGERVNLLRWSKIERFFEVCVGTAPSENVILGAPHYSLRSISSLKCAPGCESRRARLSLPLCRNSLLHKMLRCRWSLHCIRRLSLRATKSRRTQRCNETELPMDMREFMRCEVTRIAPDAVLTHGWDDYYRIYASMVERGAT